MERIDSIPNHQFTYSYIQPSGYSFCQDSVLLPWFVAQQLKDRTIDDSFRTLDVCAGCGVVGLELAHHEPRLRQMDFMEIQAAFSMPFEKNLEITGRSEFRFLNQNYETLLETSFHETYDLIVGNPPYFSKGDGKLSPSELNNRCRFFLDGDLTTLVRGVANALRPNGSAYLLVKSGASHGRDSQRTIALSLAGQATVEAVADIRGTHVVRIHKHG